MTRWRERTTVLFSTHVLSDVERVCTDVAFLREGRADIQGTISDIKANYRSDEYSIETERGADVSALLGVFPDMRLESGKAVFLADKCPLPDVLNYLAVSRLPILKLERREPTLEDLFREVSDK